MDRLFLGFFTKLLLTFMLAGGLFVMILVPRIDQRVGLNMEAALSTPLAVMAQAMAEEQRQNPGPSRFFARARVHISAPTALLSRQTLALPKEDLERLDRGEVVGIQARLLRATIYVEIPGTDQVMRLGPLNPTHPVGEERGPAILFLFAGSLVLGVYLLVRPLRRQLGSLSRAAAAFGRGDLRSRAVIRSKDAIGRLAASFNRMADEIERLILSQQELLRMVSHELRTPLQRVYFAIEIVRDAQNTERRSEGFTRAEHALQELDALIDELLTYVRLSDTAPLRGESLDLEQLVDETLEAQREVLGGIALHYTPDDRPLPRLSGQPKLLRRALQNLLGNGLRYAKSRVVLRVAPAGDLVHIDVEDDGPGIPEAQWQRIFEPFIRLDDGHTGGEAGSGLGLAIVRRIAERHRGRVEVTRSPLGGARFRLSLPIP